MAKNKNVIVVTNEENAKGANKKPKKDLALEIKSALELRASAAAEYRRLTKTFGKGSNAVVSVDFKAVQSFKNANEFFETVYLMMKNGKEATEVLEKAAKKHPEVLEKAAEEFKAAKEAEAKAEKIAALEAELKKLKEQ